MSQVFAEDGQQLPVSVVQAGPCPVVQVKVASKDHYTAVQIGFGKKKKPSKAAAGRQKDGVSLYLREFRVEAPDNFKVGQQILASVFEPGDYVDVVGIMKGRGFAGAVKRHGFKGSPASHGHDHPRAVGSIGSRFPQHTLKGTRMAGRMGGNFVTVKNLMVVDVDEKNNLLWIRGAVPGSRGGLLKVTYSGQKGEAPKIFKAVSDKPVEKISEAQPKATEPVKEIKSGEEK